MNQERDDFDPKAYDPKFQLGFLAPKYWGTWLGLIVGAPFALLPLNVHRWLAERIAKKLIRNSSSQVSRARVNLKYCYPDVSALERDKIIERMLVTAAVYLMRFPLLTLRSKSWLEKSSTTKGIEHYEEAKQAGHNVIFLVPHTWSVDVLAMLLASRGEKMCTMVKAQKNPVSEWALSKQRQQYGGRLYERSAGIKPFLKSVRDGYTGYFLPDQDHGPKKSVFVDFFATTKATLPVMGFMAKSTNATIIPVWTALDIETGNFDLEMHPPLNLPTGTPEGDALEMNKFIELCCKEKPEQYMWNLRLLSSQPDNKNLYRNARENQTKG